MFGSLYLTHGVLALAAAGAAVTAVPEGRGRPIPRWQLLVPPALACLASAMLEAYSRFDDADEPQFLMLGVIAVIAGVARGAFLGLEVDQIWHLVRLPRGGDVLAGGLAMVVLAALEMAAALAGLAGGRYELALQIGTVLVAAYLAGRAAAAWARVPQIHHTDLHAPDPRPGAP